MLRRSIGHPFRAPPEPSGTCLRRATCGVFGLLSARSLLQDCAVHCGGIGKKRLPNDVTVDLRMMSNCQLCTMVHRQTWCQDLIDHSSKGGKREVFKSRSFTWVRTAPPASRHTRANVLSGAVAPFLGWRRSWTRMLSSSCSRAFAGSLLSPPADALEGVEGAVLDLANLFGQFCSCVP